MQRHSRTQYMYANPIFRQQRSRIKHTGDQQVNAPVSWSDIAGFIGDEVGTGWQKPIGFTNTATFVVSVPAAGGLTAAAGGALTIVESPTADFLNITNQLAINVDVAVTSTTEVSIRPNTYYNFLAIANNDPVAVTVTVSNKFGARNTIKAFNITFT